ncbi:hypothetical protein [Serratia fonticola]
MTILMPVPFVSPNTTLREMNTSPPVTSMPSVWGGMQFFLDASWEGATETGRFPAESPVSAWQNAYYQKWHDAARRLKWKAPDNSVPMAAMATNPSANSGWPKLSTLAEDMIGGKPTMMTASAGQVLDLNGRPTDVEYRSEQNTATYTHFLIFKCAPGTMGGLLGQSSGTENAAVWRLGWPSASNDGQLLFQHNIANRLMIPRNVANDKPTIVIITCNANNAGTVTIVNDGTRSDHPFAFAAGFAATENLTIGGVGTGSAGTKRRFAVYSRYSRALLAEEVNILVNWSQDNYGPF